MTAALLDHLWQSTLLAGGAGLLTLAFRRNGAGVRFWLWFAASIKFLLPFAALAALGDMLSRIFPSTLPPSILALQPAAEKLSAPAQLLVGNESTGLAALLLLWMLGLAAVLTLRLARGLRLRAVIAGARDVTLPGPIRVKTSASLLEPGLVGILRPVVLLPLGLMARLSGPERDAILAHELTHLRRGDNATAAIHMAVEALFWFWPPVWLIGARLIAERERACDESVLAAGHDAEVYAGSILKVCKFCIQSPLACASGASGADLAERVRQIMTGEAVARLGAGKRLLLVCAAALAMVLPVMGGFLTSPLAVEVQTQVAAMGSHMAAGFTRNVIAMEEKIDRAAPIPARRLPRMQAMTAAAAPPSLPQADPPAPMAHPISVPPEIEAEPVSSAASDSVKEVTLALNPRGQGDPDAVTCRVPQRLPGSRLAGPQVCQTNQQWAALRARNADISADGQTVVLLGGLERDKNRTAQACNSLRMIGGMLPTFCF